MLFLLLMFAYSVPSFAQRGKPNRAAFLVEVLDAKPTALTSRFDAYHRGYYTVAKEDLLQGLITESKRRGLLLRSVSINGPVGPLWAYYIAVFFQAGDKVRANKLVFRHARINFKQTGLITGGQCNEIAASLAKAGALGTKRPPPSKYVSDNRAAAIEWGYNALLAIWPPGASSPSVRFGNLKEGQRATDADVALTKAYWKVYDESLTGLRQTYPVGKKANP
jgi:hypothetical protein